MLHLARSKIALCRENFPRAHDSRPSAAAGITGTVTKEAGGSLCRLLLMVPIQSQSIFFRLLLEKELASLQILI